jgi:hypothetical protein
MRRDGLSRNEATNIVEECLKELSVAVENGDYIEAEEIFMEYLQLEPDYLINLLMEM